MNNWIKFANTLKLRLAVRVSGVPTLASNFASAAKATESLGYIDASNAALVNPGYLNSDADGGQESPLWRYYGFNQSLTPGGGRQTYQANTYAANFYFSNNDPRLVEVYSASSTPGATTATNPTPGSAVFPTTDDQGNAIAIVSTTFGDSQPPIATIGAAQVQLSPSLIGTGLLTGPTQSAVVLSAPESLFLQAEAAQRGIIGGTPATLYDAAITASFEFDNVPSADGAAATYYAQANIAYPAGAAGSISDAQLKAIITQKWASLDVFGAFEAFNEERRTGYPNVPTSIYQGANAPHQVARIFYPFVEYATNAAAVGAQGAIDKFNSKIFWAK